MLILSRKEDESIMLGSDIKITIVGISKGGVKIGIDAPKNMMILRSELVSDVTRENRHGAQDAQNADIEELKALSEKIVK